MTLHSTSAAHTRAIGEALAAQLKAGDVLLLDGGLGAGKSELTRGIARGLGVGGYVTSPTFTILQAYDEGRLPLYHFDWYRLADAGELYEAGLDEYLHLDGVAVVEWPQRAIEALPERYLRITLTPRGETQREIELTAVGGFRELAWAALGERSNLG